MKNKITFTLLFFSFVLAYAQTKTKGIIVDAFNQPIPYCNVIFKGSIEGVITDEDGNFYLESNKTWSAIEVSFIGYKTYTLPLEKKVNYDLKITLEEETESLDEILIVTGKQPKKNNPAIDILRKIWERKRKNGLKKFSQYQYQKYEKIEFDANTIDDKFKSRKIFKGMEFIFDDIDTSNITGKTYLPIFLNESVYQVYGDNISNKKKETLKANQNSGFKGNLQIINAVEGLYAEYDIYENHLKFFDKSFSSPLSKTGIQNYNYVLSDSSYIDNKWCYNIIYYPRRKNELTFKGDFWVNDSTFAIKEINLKVSKNANVNWVKDIYIEQEFDILNDSIFVLKKDYIMSDFSFSKREKAKGMYGKKTTIYQNYKFNIPITEKNFYKKKSFENNESVFNASNDYWDKNRPEKLNEDEQKVYKLLDTLNQVKRFGSLKKIVSTLASGYFEIDKINFDYGNIFSTVGFNEVEGLRLRVGGRTYKTSNDLFRTQAYLAHGFKDQKIKYGFQGKWLFDKKNRLIISAGNRKDVEQVGASLTNSVNVLGRTEGSSSIISTVINDKLTNVNLTSFSVEAEPFVNMPIKLEANNKKLSSASETFSLDYNDPNAPSGISSEINQFETVFSIGYHHKRKISGYGVERSIADIGTTTYFAKITSGIKDAFNSDFDYTKAQFSLSNLLKIGSLGRLKTTIEAGQIFGEVPLALLSVAPGNQTYSMFEKTYNQLDFYEFVTDKYLALHLEHNFNGRILSRIPLLKKANLRTIIGFKSFLGSISDENIALNSTGKIGSIPLNAPSETPYYEYGIGVANIFKVLRLNCNFRGNYFDNNPKVRKIGFTGALEFKF